MLRIFALAFAVLAALPALAAQSFSFASIDGGNLSLDDWKGRPVLVVNTASRCGFTPQYDGLQALYERYRDRGLLVLAVPSDDFRQELGSDAAVKDFCEVNFDLDMPMTTITHVKGPEAHPLYKWLATQGFTPGWNFNKALIGPDGTLVESWGSTTRPLSAPILTRIEALLD
ncbi:glutathione peroxidase [Salipiger sp.]|uniref:glutathione peroxidase n=1 Tax=Salipiger sp. TaxID=2078585 RepID=UPI003A9776E4